MNVGIFVFDEIEVMSLCLLARLEGGEFGGADCAADGLSVGTAVRRGPTG